MPWRQRPSGAAYAVERSPTGGITGFQSGAVMWEFIRHWNHESNKCGLKLVDYDEMLYPQYASDFTNRVIHRRTMEALQKQAAEKLGECLEGHPAVREHWQSIAAGNPPFGYTVKEDR